MRRRLFLMSVAVCLLAGCAAPPISAQSTGTPTANGSSDVAGWAGEYQFEEALSSQSSIVYHLTITQAGDGCQAEVTVEGFQSMQDLLADVTGDDHAIQLVFTGYTGNNLWQPYHEGDILLTLADRGDGMLTTWGALVPQLDQNQAPGQYFQGNVG